MTAEVLPAAEIEQRHELIGPPIQDIYYVKEYGGDEQLLGELRTRCNTMQRTHEWIATTPSPETGEEPKSITELRRTLRAQILDSDPTDSADHTIRIISVGGDGTLNQVMQAIFLGHTEEEVQRIVKSIVIATIGSGTKNDVAHMVHGHKSHKDVMAILGPDTQEISVHPLLLRQQKTMPTENRPATWETVGVASYSLGLGSTAKGAEEANGHAYRERNNARPESTIDKLRTKATLFMAEVGLAYRALQTRVDGIEGHSSLSDITIANGNRQAGRFRFPVQLSHRQFFVSETSGNIVHIAYNLLDRFTGIGLSGKWVHGAYFLPVKKEIDIHIDGETRKLAPGTYKITNPVEVRFLQARSRKDKLLPPLRHLVGQGMRHGSRPILAIE